MSLLEWRRGDTRVAALASAGVLLFVGAATFVAAVILCITREPGLLRDNNLSEFGIEPATSLVFNGSLVLGGVLTAFAVFRWGGRQPWWIAVLFILSGVGMLGAGAINVDISKHLHAIFAGLDYAGHLLLPLALAPSFGNAMKVASYSAVGLSVVFLVLWALTIPLLFDTIGQGGTQLLATLPLALWMIAFSAHLIAVRIVPGPRQASSG